MYDIFSELFEYINYVSTSLHWSVENLFYITLPYQEVFFRMELNQEWIESVAIFLPCHPYQLRRKNIHILFQEIFDLYSSRLN